jgi:hypothetical protein
MPIIITIITPITEQRVISVLYVRKMTIKDPLAHLYRATHLTQINRLNTQMMSYLIYYMIIRKRIMRLPIGLYIQQYSLDNGVA